MILQRLALFVLLIALCSSDCRATSGSGSWRLPSGQGTLAVWWGASLRLVSDEGPARFVRLSADKRLGAPRKMAWSPDKTRLAILFNRALWVIDGGNGRAKPVYTSTARVDDSSDLAWSPSGNRLIVSDRHGFRVLSATGRPEVEFSGSDFTFARLSATTTWSNDGRLKDAFGIRRDQPTLRDELVRVHVALPHARVRAVFRSKWGEALSLATVIQPANPQFVLWPTAGFGADATGGLPMVVVVGGTRHDLVPRTFPTADWLSLREGQSNLAVVSSRSPTAQTWYDKYLTVCDLKSRVCHTVNAPRGKVIFDPALLRDGSIVAVEAPSQPPDALGTAPAQALWLRKTSLIRIAESGTLSSILVGNGATSPSVARDGHSVLFLSATGLSLYDERQRSVTLVVPTFPDDPKNFSARFGYFGERRAEPELYAWTRS